MLESRAYQVITTDCVGCGICAKNCPVCAITVEEKKAQISADLCVGCGICIKVCKTEAVEKVKANDNVVMCKTCPIHCCIAPGNLGACQRFCNNGNTLERIDPYSIVDPATNRIDPSTKLPTFPLMLAFGVGSNLYSADVPAKVIAGGNVDGVEIVSCVTETVLSFNGARIKIDTDEFIGPNGSPVKRNGVVVGYINTAEYGSQAMYIGGSHLNTSAGGHMVMRTTCDLLNKKPVTLRTETVKELVLQHGKPPIINGVQAQRMRIGCGTVGATTFTLERWGEKIVDEVITVDYDITSKMSAHTTAGVRYGYPDSGITPVGNYSSQGRYFGIPGDGWGGSNVMNGIDAVKSIDKSVAWSGLRLLITEPTAVRAVYFELNNNLEPVEKPIPPKVEMVLQYIRDNCEPCNCHVSVVAGFGGGIRDVISRDRSLNVNNALRQGKILYTICGQPVQVQPGGGITCESWVEFMPDNAFTWVPTPAMVCPMEVTMTKETYKEIGGYMEAIQPIEEIMKENKHKVVQIKRPKTVTQCNILD